jgi:hypothetical protein
MPLVGPILHFRGQQMDRWRLSALVVSDGTGSPGPLVLQGGGEVQAERIALRRGHGFWCYDLALPLNGGDRTVRYRVAGRDGSVPLPPAVSARRFAYAACSGTDDDEREKPSAAGSRNALWRQLAAAHRERPFHLLLQGGDQLYADTIWEEMPELGAWRRLPWREANAHPFTPGMAEEADRYYFEHYCWLWSQKDIAPLLATLPSVMMWDDHDIFDGWGSWPHDRQSCPVFAGLIGVARDYFALFQLGGLPGRLPEVCDDPDGRHFGSAYRVGSIGIVAPDLRSERTRERIMGEAGWRDFEAALKRLADCRHVILMSSVPLANTDMSLIERGFVAVPGHSDLEDDLRDQWQSFGHRDEWRRMLSTLVAFSARTGARVTSLSGEIHLGALGLIEGRGVQIHEMTSSGIVHEPPPKLVTAAYEWLGRRTTVLGPDLKACLLKIPGHGRRYLRARNWLSLDLDGDGGFVGIWNTEKGEGGRLAMASQASRELRASPEREPSHA